MRVLVVAAALLALLACLAGVAKHTLPPFLTRKLNEAIYEAVVWRPDSPRDVQERFTRDDHPGDPAVLLRTYFFNITNLDDVRTNGAKPVLAELGPYVYRKHRVKRHVWFNSEGRVRFKEYDYHMPMPHLTNGSLDDVITTLNIPLVGALEVVSSMSPASAAQWLHLLVSLIESWGDPHVKGLFTTRTVGELLWGYQDPLLARLAPVLPGIDPTFALLHNMSDPSEADRQYPTQINTGLLNISQLWQYEQWENVTEVTSWGQGHVERVRGTDAFQFRPGLGPNDTLEVWAGQLYRAATLLPSGQAMVGSVPVRRYRADPTTGEPDPRFFQTIRGLMNITGPHASGPSGRPGKPGPPLFLSYPHYCMADERLQEGVVGVRCDPQRHDLYLDVEPNTGITLRAANRLMLSSWFGRKWSAVDEGVADTFLPIFWVEEASQANEKQLQQFGPLLSTQAAIAAINAWGLPLAVAAAALAAAAAAGCAAEELWQGGGAAVRAPRWVGGMPSRGEEEQGGLRHGSGRHSGSTNGPYNGFAWQEEEVAPASPADDAALAAAVVAEAGAAPPGGRLQQGDDGEEAALQRPLLAHALSDADS